MPFVQPNRSALHTDTPLTNISVAFFQDQQNFIADRVFPTVPVNKSTDKYYTFPAGSLNRLQVEKRSRGADPAFANYAVSSDTYDCDPYALGVNIAVEDEADADAAFNLDREATEFLTRQGMINRESKWATDYFTTGKWGTDVAGVSSGENGSSTFRQWNDEASTPIEDVTLGATNMLGETGYMPNTLVVGFEVYQKLRNHPDIVDRIKYGQTSPGAAVVTTQTMASVFDVDRILVSKGIINNSREGESADDNALIMGKKALLCYSAPSAGLRTPSAGYTFAWNVYSPQGMRIRTRSIDPAIGHDVIMDDAFDQKVVSSDLGYFFNTIVA